MVRACATPKEVRGFCEFVSAETTKSLSLLKDIETTVFWLSLIQRHADTNCGFATKVVDAIKVCERANPIDPEGMLGDTIEGVENGLNDLYHALIAKREAARRAAELDGPDKELIVDEYTTAIEAVADLHNAMHDLRWAVMEHDADLDEGAGKTYTDVDKMFADSGL
ncbi:MAG: hypothetical protein HZA59_07750 [Hydrogenophilales bacterium]|nr:hypothetical protein [Hydrogenophilales bacterium]